MRIHYILPESGKKWSDSGEFHFKIVGRKEGYCFGCVKLPLHRHLYYDYLHYWLIVVLAVVVSVINITVATAPSGPRPPHHRGIMITLRHIKLYKTPVV
jgi:hypothetical protein